MRPEGCLEPGAGLQRPEERNPFLRPRGSGRGGLTDSYLPCRVQTVSVGVRLRRQAEMTEITREGK